MPCLTFAEAPPSQGHRGYSPSRDDGIPEPPRTPPTFDIPPPPLYTGPTFDPRETRSWRRRRNRPVEVQTPAGWFHCDRDDLLVHFPALREEPFGRRLRILDYIRVDGQHSGHGHGHGPQQFCDDDDAEAAATTATAAMVVHVLPHLFRGLERHRVAGEPFELFERADDMLERTADGPRGFAAAARFFVGACCALAADGGLGCSEALLDQVDEFVVGLLEMREPLPPVHPPLRPPLSRRHRRRGTRRGPRCSSPAPPPVCIPVGATSADDDCCRDIVVAYSKVFRPSSPGHMETLRRVWHLTPLRVRVRISAELVAMCERTARTASVQVFFRALRDLSLA